MFASQPVLPHMLSTGHSVGVHGPLRAAHGFIHSLHPYDWRKIRLCFVGSHGGLEAESP